MESTIEYIALQTRYRNIITSKHGALIVPSFDWATWWQRSWVPRPIGARVAPLNRQYREPKSKSRDDLRVSTVTTTFLLIVRSAPTFDWRVHLQFYQPRRSPLAEAFYSHVYLRRRIILRTKHSYRHEYLHERSALTEKPTPQLKHIYDEKLSLEWSEL